MRALVVVPFVLPTVVVALAFLAVLPDGLERGWAAILVAHASSTSPSSSGSSAPSGAGLDPRVSEAAATLGAGPWRRLREVTLPLLAPSLAAAAAIVFLFTFTSFGIVHARRARIRHARGGDLQPDRQRSSTCRRRRSRPRPVRRVAATLSRSTMDHRRESPRRRSPAEQRGASPAPGTGQWSFLVAKPRGGSPCSSGCPRRAGRTVAGIATARARRTTESWANPPAALLASPGGGRELAALRRSGHRVALLVGDLAARDVARERGSCSRRRTGQAAARHARGHAGFSFVIAFDTPPIDLRIGAVDRPRPGAGRHAVRGHDPRPGPARHRRAPPGSRRPPRRSPGRVMTGVDLPIRVRPRGRGRLRVRDLARRVRGHRVHGQPGQRQRARRDLPLPGPAGRAQLRAGMRAEQ